MVKRGFHMALLLCFAMSACGAPEPPRQPNPPPEPVIPAEQAPHSEGMVRKATAIALEIQADPASTSAILTRNQLDEAAWSRMLEQVAGDPKLSARFTQATGHPPLPAAEASAPQPPPAEEAPAAPLPTPAGDAPAEEPAPPPPAPPAPSP